MIQTCRSVQVLLALLLVSTSILARSASAQSPAAIVEEVRGNASGVQFMDYLTPGKVIRLEADDLLVLSYLKSCWRETIFGGTVTVGIERSEVELGKVERTKTECQAGQMQLTPQQANQSAGMVFRGKPSHASGSAGTSEPPVTPHRPSPPLEAEGGGTPGIERPAPPRPNLLFPPRQEGLLR